MAEYPIINFDFVGKKFSYPLIRRKSWNTDVVSYDSSLEQTNELWNFPVRYWGIQYKLLKTEYRNKVLELFDACRGQARQIYFEDNLDYQSECSWTQPTYIINAVDQTEDYFRFSGQHASDFLVGWEFKVTGSTGNDGVYAVSDISQDDSYTYLYVEEEIASAVADGTILRMYFQLYKTYYDGEDYSFDEPKQDIKPDVCVVEVDSAEQSENVDYTLTDTNGVIKFVTGSTPTAGQVIEASFDFYYRVRFMSDTFEDSNFFLDRYDPDVVWVKEIKRRTTVL